jgi:hypothetical protein
MDDRVRRWLVARPSAFASADISSRSRRRVRDGAFASRTGARREPRAAIRARALSSARRREFRRTETTRASVRRSARLDRDAAPRRAARLPTTTTITTHARAASRYIARPTNVERGYAACARSHITHTRSTHLR